VQKPSIAPPRIYAPLRETLSLFRTFADVEISEAGIEAFAHKYGVLGLSETLIAPMEIGERLARWRREIIILRRLIEIWEAVKVQKLEVLQKYIHWRGAKDVVFQTGRAGADTQHQSFSVIVSETSRPDVFRKFKPGDVLAPSNLYLQQAINDELRKKGVCARLLWDTGWRSTRLHIVPVNLIGCIWLQFAKAVEGKKEYRQCENCFGWIEVGGGKASRSDKRFCSPTCKATAHRKKRERARKLAARGITRRAIALELNTELTKVNNWVKS
jgi:hypothetical protein